MAIAEAELSDIRHALADLAAVAAHRPFNDDERARFAYLLTAELRCLELLP